MLLDTAELRDSNLSMMVVVDEMKFRGIKAWEGTS